MANKQHLKILREGVGPWNTWRSNNPAVIPDLSKANLSGMHLAKIDFRNANLRDADLTKTDLTAANLNGANTNGVKGLGGGIRGALTWQGGA